MTKASTRKLIMLFPFFLNFNFASSQPMASFIVDKHDICSGQTVNFNNTSSASNTYQWLIEGVHYSSSRDTIAVLYEDCYDLKEIKLIISDSTTGLSYSASIVVEVFDTCYFHWTGTFLNCPNDTVLLAANTEAIATEFFISEPVTILSGCLLCPSIEFILHNTGTYVDRTTTYQGGCYDVTSYEYVCTTSNINEHYVTDIKIYPNPLTDNFSVIKNEKNPVRIEVSTIGGKTLIEQILIEKRTLIDFSAFPAGVYLCKLYVNNKIPAIRKIIKH